MGEPVQMLIYFIELWNYGPFKMAESTYVPVAQLDRALACGAKGRTFESYRAYHN